MRYWIVMGLLVSAGCGGGSHSAPPDAPPSDSGDPTDTSVFDIEQGIHSGTRLKLQYNDFSGVRTLNGVFDHDRNETCTPHLADDGKEYCIPVLHGTVVYADAGCTQPLGRNTDAPCGISSYYRLTNSASCDGALHKVFSRGTAAPPAQYYRGSPESCAGPFDARPGELATLGAEVPFSAFVQLTRVTTDHHNQLEAQYYETADGARIEPTLFDSQRHVVCDLGAGDDPAKAVCNPVERAISFNSFASADCTGPVAPSAASCPGPAYIEVFDVTCPLFLVSRVHAAGALIHPDTVYASAGSGVCGPTGLLSGFDYYPAGPDLTPSLPQLTRAVDAVPGARLQPIRSSDGRARVLLGTMYDTTLNTDCVPTRLDDGTTRCLPISSFPPAIDFTDSDCKTPIAVVNVPPTCGVIPMTPFAIFERDPEDSCADPHEVRRLGEVYTGPLFSNETTICTPVTGVTTYKLGPAIPFDQFPAATVTTDP